MTLTTVRTELRAAVGDQQSQKFTDSRLDSILSRVLNEINYTFRVKVSVKYLPVSAYQEYVGMPSDMFRLSSVWQRKSRIEIRSNIDESRSHGSTTEKYIDYIYYGERGFLTYGVQPLLESPESECIILDKTSSVVAVDLDAVDAIVYMDDIYYLLYNDTDMSDPDNLPSYAVSVTYPNEILEVYYMANIDSSSLSTELAAFPDIFMEFLINKSASVALTDDNRQENVQKAQLFEQRAAMDLRTLQRESQLRFNHHRSTTGYNSHF